MLALTGRPVLHGVRAASDGASGRGAVIGPHRGRRARRRPYLAVRPVRRALHRVMRQRVRRQCCTRGRSRPAAHPRQLAGVLMGDEPARRFLCARCRAPALVCSRCDRGQIYCAAGCAAVVRQQSQREAGLRYQCSRPGRFKHAARTRRWRERQALLAVPVARSEMATPQSVTHQGSLLPASGAVLVAVPTPMAVAAVPAALAAPAPSTQSCTTTTTSGASSPAATLPLTLSAWRCHWCHTPCAARVRLDFLRHGRSPRPRRRASARVEPSHGHSP